MNSNDFIQNRDTMFAAWAGCDTVKRFKETVDLMSQNLSPDTKALINKSVDMVLKAAFTEGLRQGFRIALASHLDEV